MRCDGLHTSAPHRAERMVHHRSRAVVRLSTLVCFPLTSRKHSGAQTPLECGPCFCLPDGQKDRRARPFFFPSLLPYYSTGLDSARPVVLVVIVLPGIYPCVLNACLRDVTRCSSPVGSYLRTRNRPKSRCLGGAAQEAQVGFQRLNNHWFGRHDASHSMYSCEALAFSVCDPSLSMRLFTVWTRIGRRLVLAPSTRTRRLRFSFLTPPLSVSTSPMSALW